MRKRVTALLITGLAVCAVGSTTSVAIAKHGADDPAGHVRHGHGKDDPAGHARRGGGADDGANHR